MITWRLGWLMARGVALRESGLERVAVRVTGVVQGVGFRPFACGLARSLGITGHVGNDGAGVFCEAEGHPAVIAEFLRRLTTDAPAAAVIERVAVTRGEPCGDVSFVITGSRASAVGDVALIPPDMAVCEHCMREVRDPANRRYRYPFTGCAQCGPRYTLARGVPYDRPFTTMAGFPLCGDCLREYSDPADRRFHAQPTACPACGPGVSFTAAGDGEPGSRHDEAIADAIRVLGDGGVVAVKGVGGYHLACDAHNAAAVARLRERKRRSAKPFAVLARDLAVAASLGAVDAAAAALLTSSRALIVLVPAATSGAGAAVAASVAPGNGFIGLLLPYTPLLHLLLSPHPALDHLGPGAVVLTSGNLAAEPLVTEPAEAHDRLAGIADAWLDHDRPIPVGCDDSVVRVVGGEPQPVRRSRGYTPLPIPLPLDAPPLLAVGGELKTTVCLASGRRGWMSQHIGDTGNAETLVMLDRVSEALGSLARIRPEIIVADMHPGYLSRGWAERHAGEAGAKLQLVQHHHAHLAALLAEHLVAPGEDVLGVIFDGTGYGGDGTVWGGELLLGSYRAVRRVGHLAPFPLPGGDAAVQRPARVALAWLRSAGVGWDERLPPVAVASGVERRVIDRMLATGTGCVPATSMGRLFDAMSSLAGVCHDVTYEAQAAIELEALAQAGGAPARWRYGVRHAGDMFVLDPVPVLRAAAEAVLSGMLPGAVSASFHEATAEAVAEAAAGIRAVSGATTVGLSGGVFQNSLLTRLCRERLEKAGFRVLTHRQVPPNDGGLALGQAAVAAAGGGV